MPSLGRENLVIHDRNVSTGSILVIPVEDLVTLLRHAI